ncbi:ATP-dependent Clp protease ATP-binding subunit CLPT2, chloroplastic isoform X2 [Sesamum indicum]|uniref:ATP-dependent Clp protease ATP-binding subunit CLPT2, chloroplastic isoform X2 n=1 Tax=Sesamum indicum TaxID=4182 RepID=A0A6I9SJF3_SESIN|nr:ATP-dependent Clp protease ATP-binding subunit CLPT2, chloroplastic isoform X2 [Sesamum indicum]
MAAHSLSATSITRPELKQFNLNKSALGLHISLRSQWLGTIAMNKFSLQSSSIRPLFTRRRRISATISFSLPTSKPDRTDATEKIPRWSSKAIKSFAMSELEARKIKSPTTDTEALLMGILIEGTSFASKFLRANGITLLKVRDEILKLRGKPEMFFFSPEHPPLTEAAQRALDWAIDEKLKSDQSERLKVKGVVLEYTFVDTSYSCQKEGHGDFAI